MFVQGIAPARTKGLLVSYDGKLHIFGGLQTNCLLHYQKTFGPACPTEVPYATYETAFMSL